ncbi:glucosamine kinase [Albidovulum inexpectatum]|uniref:Glucosamine kinase n=1 Tax=Albidovulum inexpectatum TaxID=196587 RepID=A0A2S5JJV1_9RHOB|nr:BadF/BadG/BcrA/BcrD ATPase family protein [Albidovulum inexpectatum]PPB81535.1 glucosamine kinase [Albidovulum inexpectatum]
MRPVLIGIDGGGSGSRAACLLPDGHRTEVTGGPANVSLREEALNNIKALLVALCTKAGLQREQLAEAKCHIGLAGVLEDQGAKDIAVALGLPKATMSDDQITTITGALADGDGIVVAIGTGSFLGRKQGEHIRRIGGWGLALGDEASGAWMGRRALSLALKSCDGLAPVTAFARRILDRFDGAAGVVRFSLRAAPSDYAALAPEILQAAGQGDDMALSILRDGVGYLQAGIAVLDDTGTCPVCLAGGLGPHYAGFLPHDLKERLIPAAGTALDGALLMAARNAEFDP